MLAPKAWTIRARSWAIAARPSRIDEVTGRRPNVERAS
jgi:hypothetical protein